MFFSLPYGGIILSLVPILIQNGYLVSLLFFAFGESLYYLFWKKEVLSPDTHHISRLPGIKKINNNKIMHKILLLVITLLTSNIS